MESETNHDLLDEDLNDADNAEGLELKDENPPPPLYGHYAADETDASGSVYTESEDGTENSLKRPAERELVPRIFKRQRGVLNTDYLDLLNRDIEDTAQRVCFADDNEETLLYASQIGLTYWSIPEKKLFFEAIARLGKCDLPGIASRIGTKSEIEVNHYLDVLQKARLMRQRAVRRPAIEFSEVPAAVELSQQCCHALDEAADAISVRQERKEEQREENKWGNCWDITPRIARRLDNGEIIAEGQDLPFSKLFNIHAWLKLSERIFMNSSIPSENWDAIDNRPPSMWATTFEDFHSLAVSITKRLVQTTIFLSESRIRAKRELIPTTREIVRAQDVEAAVFSLGLNHNSHRFWSNCARRLRLEVYEEPPLQDEEVECEPLSYEQVENLLPIGDEDADQFIGLQPKPDPEEIIYISEDNALGSDFEEPDFEESPQLFDEEGLAIEREANEVLQFSAADFPETYRKKETLKNRIAVERRQEQYAEERDQYVSWQAENEMWDLLQKKPPIELPKMPSPGPLQRSTMDVESIFPIGRDWRTKTKYSSEWEGKYVGKH
ncbi:RNA polymerase I-specific transcription initiation factor rrn5 [Fusarium austroafricanum]|uniref:RNA polymerase I-specific transcription initiation factor rrn5 n=1 Tax=Fusarium austroafricanum TaxID=2364996 RepID=A0A8H4KWJ7_9HYPO|nr:RNA polymerase I-specific transcription initiation factor rrn5 [Fusarium austroafricanum]